jgi:hypothetical protein
MEHHPPPKISEIAGAAAVHVLTASGAAFGPLALLAASESHWAASFGWLGVVPGLIAPAGNPGAGP